MCTYMQDHVGNMDLQIPEFLFRDFEMCSRYKLHNVFLTATYAYKYINIQCFLLLK